MSVANFWFGGFVVESETMTVEGSETLPMNPESETWKSLLRCATLCSRAEFVRFEIYGELGWVRLHHIKRLVVGLGKGPS